MIDESPRIKAGVASFVFVGLLIALNSLALLFSASMLCWAIVEMQTEGEQWGLVGVLIFGGIAFPVQLLLLVLTILLAALGRKLKLWLRLICVLVISTAILLDAGALACVFFAPDQHKRRFEKQSAFYQSGLHEAVERGNVERTKAILRKDPDLIYERDYHNDGVLIMAARNDDKSMVETLLQHGANASEGNRGVSALHVAVGKNNLEIVGLLIDRGAQINVEDQKGRTPLTCAKASGSTEMIRLLSERGGKETDYEAHRIKAAEARLIKAVQKGNIPHVEQLLDQGLSIDTAAGNGHCLLDFAAERGDIEMGRFLISCGASVTRTDRYGRTALHWASGEGNAEMVRFLIEEGANINARDYQGMTPIHQAIVWTYGREVKSLEVVKVLVEEGADVNAESNEGITPMKWARKYGTEAIRSYLQAHGASD